MIRLFPLLVVLALAACSKSAPAAASAATTAVTGTGQPSASASQAAPDAAKPEPAAAKPVPAQLPETVATVNGEVISKAELEEALGELEARAGGPIPTAQRDEIVRGVLDQVIGYRLLMQESAARPIAVTDAELDARIAQIRQQFDTEEAFQQALTQRKMTLDTLRSEIRNGLRIDKLIDAEMAGAPAITAEQVAEFYKQNPTQFQQAERVRASHILIRFPENADAAAKEQARAQASKVLEDVKAGKDFAALATQHSQDPGSAVNGGDLGFFERGQMVGPFDQAAFSLQANQTSELVETNFGYHIIKVAEHQAARTVPLDEVRPQIQQYLEEQGRDQRMSAFVASLRARGKVEIFI